MSRKVGIVLSSIVAVVAGLWLWAGIIPKNSTQIGGSTSVNALMQLLTNTYRKSYKGDSFIYASSGSTGGVNNAKAGTYKIGFVSRGLDESTTEVTTQYSDWDKSQEIKLANVNDSNYIKLGTEIYNYLIQPDKYTSDEMHYVQVATDAIILTYKAPKWFNDNFAEDFNITPNDKDKFEEQKKIIQKIYSGDCTWQDVAKMINPSASIPADAKAVKITAYDREPGSGTRNAFDKYFGLTNENSDGPAKTGGAPSNGVMWENLNGKADNSFGYLSLSFIDKIQGADQLRTVKVNGVDPKTDKNFEKNIDDSGKDSEKYSLIRPYIGLIKSDLDKKEMKKVSDFLAWIATATTENSKGNNAKEQYVGAGLKPVFKLDDPTVPGAPQNVQPKKAIQVNKMNDTQMDLKRVIKAGYLPRH